MSKQELNFHKTSNTAIEINIMYCYSCMNPFYELEGHEIDDCPNCGSNFAYQEPTKEDSDYDSYRLIVDPKTGVPRVVRQDGEPVDPVPTIKPGDKVRHLWLDMGIGEVVEVHPNHIEVQFPSANKPCKRFNLEVVKDE